MESTDAVGNRDLINAHAPVTCGAAIEVPLNVLKPPPGTDDVIHSPGASIVRNDALFENAETPSVGVAPLLPSFVDPTLMAVEMQLGKEIPMVEDAVDEFPDEITVAIPTLLRLSMAVFNDGKPESQIAVEENTLGVPRLRFTAAMLKLLRSA